MAASDHAAHVAAPEELEDVRLATTRVFVRRRRLVAGLRWLGGLSLAAWVTAFVLDFVLHRGDGVLPFVISLALGLAGVVTLGIVARTDPRGRVVRHVRVEGTRAVPRISGPAARHAEAALRLDDAVSGWRSGETSIALLDAQGALHELDVGSADVAERLLARLGLSLEDRVLTVPLAPEGGARPGAQVLGLGLLVFLFVGVMMAGAKDIALGLDFAKAVAMSFSVGVSIATTIGVKRGLDQLEHGEVRVGTDGVSIRRARVLRFVPIGEITDVSVDGRTVVFTRGTGPGLRDERIVIAVAETGEADEARARAVADATKEAMELRRRRSSTLGASLERGALGVGAWRTELTRVARAGGDYRSARLGPAELGAVVLDPSAPPDRRVGAALALAATSPEDARSRVRIAVNALADDALRASLVAAAEGEIDEAHLDESMRRRAKLQR